VSDEFQSVLVTGGAGFVGSAVLERLLEDFDGRVTVVDNLFNGRREYVPDDPRVAFVAADLRDRTEIARIVADAQPQAVLHLAALHFIPYCNRNPGEAMEVNVVGTQNLLQALAAHKPRVVVAASTAAVYPICDAPCREDDVIGPTDIYGVSKWTNEQQLNLFSAETGVPCAAGRFFNVFGPRETNPHVIPEIIKQILEGATQIKLGNVKPKRDYVFTEDVADAVLALAEQHRAGFRPFNVGTGNEYSVEEVAQAIAQVSGRPVEIVIDPARVRPSDRLHLACDYSRIEREMGWRPRQDLPGGLRAAWEDAVARFEAPVAV
jgi:UDP-glucose 4-epimerase